MQDLSNTIAVLVVQERCQRNDLARQTESSAKVCCPHDEPWRDALSDPADDGRNGIGASGVSPDVRPS